MRPSTEIRDQGSEVGGQKTAPTSDLRFLTSFYEAAGNLLRGALAQTVRGWMRLFHGLTIHGQEHWPIAPPFVLVANHASHLDTLVLAAALPPHLRRHLHPLAAADVFFRTPLCTRLASRLLGALPFSRRGGLHQLLDLRRRLERDRCVLLLYPEGTRSRTGRMAPFRHGLGVLTAGSRVPVVPCYLQGAFAALPAGQILPRPRKLTLTIGRPLSFADIDDTRRGWEHVGTCVEAAVRRLGGLTPPRRVSDNFTSAVFDEDACDAFCCSQIGV
jgi:1-acyl-sn-glycerol-3-phosphate acyltransferase